LLESFLLELKNVRKYISFLTEGKRVFFLWQEKEIRRFAGTVPNRATTGDIESMAMYAGQGVGLIKEILPAGEVVRRLVQEAQLLIQQRFQES